MISHTDKRYPNALKELEDAPEVLYIKGELLPQDARAIAIVGTRQCTTYGREMAEQFAFAAAASGFTVVSGLARGIDTAAHAGALKGGRTIAVLGSGLGHIYPKENRALADAIAKQGAVITEFPEQAEPQKHHFPKRNRIVAALSQAVLLIEAPIKSGAMITVDLALSQGKACFTIPGRADIESFRGNHFLIKQQKAKLVENWQEMLSLLAPGSVANESKKLVQLEFDLDADEQNVMRYLSSEEIFIEELAAKSRLPIANLNSLLMGLVLKQKVRELPGKFFKKEIC